MKLECSTPGSCTLASDEMLERVSAWREVSSHAISRQIEADRITSVYPNDADLLRRLENLIAAEALCCSFLKFTINQQKDHTLVELRFPPEARPLLEAVI